MGKLFRYDSFCNLLQETTRHRRKRKVVPKQQAKEVGEFPSIADSPNFRELEEVIEYWRDKFSNEEPPKVQEPSKSQETKPETQKRVFHRFLPTHNVFDEIISKSKTQSQPEVQKEPVEDKPSEIETPRRVEEPVEETPTQKPSVEEPRKQVQVQQPVEEPKRQVQPVVKEEPQKKQVEEPVREEPVKPVKEKPKKPVKPLPPKRKSKEYFR